MSWAKMSESARSLIFAVAVIGIGAFALWAGARTNMAGDQPASNAPAADFPGTGTGAIPDGGSTCPTPGLPLNVTFNVTGISTAPSSVALSTTFGGPNHTWMCDVLATLIAPNGASHTIFGRTLSTTAAGVGDSSDLGGAYSFADANATPPSGGWWQAATAAGTTTVVAPGAYRTTNSGGAGATNPMPPTSMNAAFAGIPTSNGTWTLRVTDGCSLDTGAISAATLSLTGGSAVPTKANTDVNGDGKTDYVVARGTATPLAENAVSTAPFRRIDSSQETKVVNRKADDAINSPAAPPIYWYSSINGSGTTTVAQLGDAATDFLIAADFDGDSKSDYTVWRPGAPTVAAFYILRTSDNTVKTELFGQTGDDPAIVGDYDGDGKADPTTYRCPAIGTGDGQCYFFYRGSNNNPNGNVTYVPWGFGEDGDFFPLLGDFDGDGKNDFCVQRANPTATSQGQFVLLKSSNLGVEYIDWGLSSDFLIPGDYDGDGKSDFAVRRTVSGNRFHWILTRTGATSVVQFGVSGDSSAPGDYDGDGKTDVAVWRQNVDPSQNFFYVLNSSTGAVSFFEWGQQNDFAVAGWAVH